MNPYTAFLGVVVGLAVGSFVATVAARAERNLSALNGRSRCDGCGRTLSAAELVPVIGWVWLRGRSRCCRMKIDASYPVIEIVGGLVGATALGAGVSAQAFAGAALGWTLLLLARLDLRLFWLPDRFTLPLMVAGLSEAAIGLPGLIDRIFGVLCGFLVLEIVRHVYLRTRGQAGMGGGDPKLMAAIGGWVGWQALPTLLMGASLLGLMWALASHRSGRPVSRNTALPFGAMLAPVGYTVWLVHHYLGPSAGLCGLQP